MGMLEPDQPQRTEVLDINSSQSPLNDGHNRLQNIAATLSLRRVPHSRGLGITLIASGWYLPEAELKKNV